MVNIINIPLAFIYYLCDLYLICLIIKKRYLSIAKWHFELIFFYLFLGLNGLITSSLQIKYGPFIKSMQ